MYTIAIPADSPKSLDVALSTLARIASKLQLSRGLESEKAVVRAETYSGLSEVGQGSRLDLRWASDEDGWVGASRWTPEWSERLNLDAVQLYNLQFIYNENYQLPLCHLLVTGKVDRSIVAHLETHFAGDPSPHEDQLAPSGEANEKSLTTNHPLAPEQANSFDLWQIIPENSETPAEHSHSAVLDRFVTLLLSQRLRLTSWEPRSPLLGPPVAYATAHNWLGYGYFKVHGDSRPNGLAESTRQVLVSMAEVWCQGFHELEIEEARQTLVAEALQVIGHVEALNAWEAMGLLRAEALGFFPMLGTSERTVELEHFRSVTREELNQWFRFRFDLSGPLLTSFHASPNEQSLSVEWVKATFEAARAIWAEVPPLRDNSTPTPAPHGAGAIESRSPSMTFGRNSQTLHLANGITVIVVPGGEKGSFAYRFNRENVALNVSPSNRPYFRTFESIAETLLIAQEKPKLPLVPYYTGNGAAASGTLASGELPKLLEALTKWFSPLQVTEEELQDAAELWLLWKAGASRDDYLALEDAISSRFDRGFLSAKKLSPNAQRALSLSKVQEVRQQLLSDLSQYTLMLAGDVNPDEVEVLLSSTLATPKSSPGVGHRDITPRRAKWPSNGVETLEVPEAKRSLISLNFALKPQATGDVTMKLAAYAEVLGRRLKQELRYRFSKFYRVDVGLAGWSNPSEGCLRLEVLVSAPLDRAVELQKTLLEAAQWHLDRPVTGIEWTQELLSQTIDDSGENTLAALSADLSSTNWLPEANLDAKGRRKLLEDTSLVELNRLVSDSIDQFSPWTLMTVPSPEPETQTSK